MNDVHSKLSMIIIQLMLMCIMVDPNTFDSVWNWFCILSFLGGEIMIKILVLFVRCLTMSLIKGTT